MENNESILENLRSKGKKKRQTGGRLGKVDGRRSIAPRTSGKDEGLMAEKNF